MAGPLLALQVVVFAFVGVELLGVTAGESKDPEKTLPTAVRRVIWRIGLFYLGALTAVMALVPWNQLDPHVSPFVLVFAKVGIPAAAAVVNTVVLTAALASVAVMLLGVAANYFVPEKAFAYVTSVATVAAVFTWGIISSAHLRFRAAVRAGRLRPVAFRMPLAPVSNYFVLAFLSYTQPHHARRVRPALAPPPTTPPTRIAVRPLQGAGHRGPTDGGRAPGRRSGGVLGGCWRRSHKSPAGSGHCSAGHLLAPIP